MAKIGAQAKLTDTWDKRLARQAASGKPLTQFCDEEGVSVAAFYSQLKKGRGRSAGTGSVIAQPKRVATPRKTSTAAEDHGQAATSLFRPLRVTSSPLVRQRVRVRLPGENTGPTGPKDPHFVAHFVADVCGNGEDLEE